MAGKGLNTSLRDLVEGFLANTRRDQKFRKRIEHEILSSKIALSAKLISRPDEIINVNQCTFAQLVHRLSEPKCISCIDKLTSQALKVRGIAQKIKHHGTTAAGVMNLHVD